MTEYIKDLGYANGLKETPDIVKKCKELGHELKGEKDRSFNCVHHTCSWKETPDIVKKCKELGHELKGEKDRSFNCVHHTWCPVCKYRYSIDSSG